MWQSGILSGNERRIFVNTSIGCKAKCSYCYLPHLTANEKIVFGKRCDPAEIITELTSAPAFQPGKRGTIISVGCYSECWDDENKPATKSIIANLAPQGNPIQLSTKFPVLEEELEGIRDLLKWENQLSVFVSCATITGWEKFENGTPAPMERFKTFASLRKIGIPSFLYIKPVLSDITILDIETFNAVLDNFQVPVVLGCMYVPSHDENDSPVGGGSLGRQFSQERDLERGLHCAKSIFNGTLQAVEYLRG